MSNKKLFSLISVGLIGVTLILGFSIIKNIENKVNKKYENIAVGVNGDLTLNKEMLNKKVNKDAEVIFKTNVNKENKYITEVVKKAKDMDLAGKRGIDLEGKFKDRGYVLKNITDNIVEFIRKPIKYKANKYVLMVENNEIIIGKSDKNGNVFDSIGNINNRQGTGTKINSLREEDRLNILMGNNSIQYDNIEKLNDGIRGFDIKYEMPE